jgi:hypothetical protein
LQLDSYEKQKTFTQRRKAAENTQSFFFAALCPALRLCVRFSFSDFGLWFGMSLERLVSEVSHDQKKFYFFDRGFARDWFVDLLFLPRHQIYGWEMQTVR